MKTDSVDNKLRLAEALKPQSTNLQKEAVQKDPAQLAKTPDRIGDRSTDAVRTTVDARLSESSEATTGSGRSLEQIAELVRSGRYFEETPIDAVAEAVGRELL